MGHRGGPRDQSSEGRTALDRRGHRLRTLQRPHPHQTRDRHPGESVACCTADGQLTIDDEPLAEPYVFNDYAFEPGTLDCTSTPRSQRCFDAVEVPADSYLMLGDNRANSSDSAAFCRGDAPAGDCWRWATRQDLVGKAVLLFWPFTRWTGL